MNPTTHIVVHKRVVSSGTLVRYMMESRSCAFCELSIEACVNIRGYVDSQKNAFPILIHEIPLHDVTVGVWCAVSGTRTSGKIFMSLCIQNDFIYTFGHVSEHLLDYERTCTLLSARNCNSLLRVCITFYLATDRSITAQYII